MNGIITGIDWRNRFRVVCLDDGVVHYIPRADIVKAELEKMDIHDVITFSLENDVGQPTDIEFGKSHRDGFVIS